MTDETPNPTVPEPEADPATSTPPARDTTRDQGPDLAAPEPAGPRRAVSSADPPPRRPDYRGAELDPERGPGLGCFWFQLIVLAFFIVIIPIGLELNWPFELLATLLFVVIGLLLLTGQSVIFLLRLVAADRRAQGRRRPLASPTKTVGELEDAQRVANAAGSKRPAARPGTAPAPDEAEGAGDGAPATTEEGDATPPRDTAGGDAAAAAVRTRGSLPESHEGGAILTGDAGVADADVDADDEHAAGVADADGDADDGDAAPAGPSDEAAPEEPDPGVRQ